MADLREQLQQLFQGKVCLMGLGSVEYGDDGFGVRLAEELKSEVRSPKSEGRARGEDRNRWAEVVVAGTYPERLVGRVEEEGYDHLIFVDAVEFGGVPGSVALLDSEQMVTRFPQVSTHKISLGLLARHVEATGKTKAWLLGVQPGSVRPGVGLSAPVTATVDLLVDLVMSILQPRAPLLTNTGASARCQSRVRHVQRFQQFPEHPSKPLKRIEVAEAPFHRAKAPVLMRADGARRGTQAEVAV